MEEFIFLTNDDGIQAKGIVALEECLRDAGINHFICAPLNEKAAPVTR